MAYRRARPQHGRRRPYEILSGAPPSSVEVPPQLPGQPIFDWRELQRWNIPESRLPAGSVSASIEVRTSGANTSGTVLIAAGALADSGASDHRAAVRASRAAASRNRKPDRIWRLAADASRRETMSALTSSIAHELSSAHSAAMIHNAEALQMMINDQSRDARRTSTEILADIHDRRRPRRGDHRAPSGDAPQSRAAKRD